MGGMMAMLRANGWAAIGVLILATAGLIAIGQQQAASLLGCVAGILLMWKSESGRPSAPEEAGHEA
ncbi:hypothetical protein SAMN02927895_02864 [Belnapia rosea]|jgi:membrane associated rhomboid family serine protease|uniref:Uncharacterized protein n=2 Tax=Belnapia rosea TaxID=938405 RepID=A0A1G6NTL9_9PROT|nr:hypothetical protein SAMN02927895_02864 [Belnapia rosea]SDC71138.1 hypothetical protein SAMN04487779_1002140 [Belnapia rosea]